MVLVASATGLSSRPPDIVLHKGKEFIWLGSGYQQAGNPIESYFLKFPDKRPATDRLSTILLTGSYRTTFEIVEGDLLLVSVNPTTPLA